MVKLDRKRAVIMEESDQTGRGWSDWKSKVQTGKSDWKRLVRLEEVSQNGRA
jgi:hypothetical protein